MKLSSSDELLYATYIGGVLQSPIGSIAVDGFGNPYFTLVNSGSASTVVALAADGTTVLRSKQFASAVGAVALDGNGGLIRSWYTRPCCVVLPYDARCLPIFDGILQHDCLCRQTRTQ